jgi:hypothetical protein
MLRELLEIKPQFCICLPSRRGGMPNNCPDSEYHAILDNTLFAPCPMGNAMLETWRFYEALEAGCIPIIEARPWMHYHERLLGPHPVPTVYRWSQARSLIQWRCLRIREPLKALQQHIRKLVEAM